MKHLPGSPRRRLVAAMAILSFVAAASAAAALRQAAAYPGSVVVLGQSDALAYGSDPLHAYRDTPANSWATGTNPAVDSIYSRILAVNPAVRGHIVNLASDEAGIDDLAAQVARAVKLTPKPGLVIVQIGGDVNCDGKDQSRVAEYRTALSSALGTLSNSDPDARVFLASEWGSFPSYISYLRGLSKDARLKHAGKGPCQMVAAPSGQIEPSHVAYIQKITYSYNAQLAAVCRRIAHCRYDGGAAQRMAVSAADLSTDQDHLTLQGQTKLAGTEWPAIRKLITEP